MKIYEMFHSIQGEGPAMGNPAIFVRLANCNLKCMGCDTPSMKIQDAPVNMIYKHIREHLSRHPNNTRIVITGGEPLLQSDEVLLLVDMLSDKKVDLETNGTIFLSPEIAGKFRFISVSPKRDSFKSLQQTRDFFNNWKSIDNCIFKFVLGTAPWMYNEATLKSLIEEFDLDPGKIFVMPGGSTQHELSISGPNTWKSALRLGCNFSDRLHIRNNGK